MNKKLLLNKINDNIFLIGISIVFIGKCKIKLGPETKKIQTKNITESKAETWATSVDKKKKNHQHLFSETEL